MNNAGDYPDWANAQPVFLFLDSGQGLPPARLRHDNGALAVVSAVEDFAAIASGTLNVSTLTPLDAWRDLSAYGVVVFEAWTDSANEVNLIVEKSPDAVHPNIEQQLITVTTGKAVSVEVTQLFEPF